MMLLHNFLFPPELLVLGKQPFIPFLVFPVGVYTEDLLSCSRHARPASH